MAAQGRFDEQLGSKPVGMVGGGPGAGIGETHRIAMRIDDKCQLVAGVFSRDPEKSALIAQQLRIPIDGVKGLAFVEAFLRSHSAGGSWTSADSI
jgi:predicted dehydrogenase